MLSTQLISIRINSFYSHALYDILFAACVGRALFRRGERITVAVHLKLLNDMGAFI